MKTAYWLLIAVMALAGCGGTASQKTESGMAAPAEQVSATPRAVHANYPDLGAAPELTNQVWVNADAPLRLKDLRGKVVLIDMWTFGCINCQHVIPSLRGWHNSYASQGLVVIGNHFPEFSYEKDLNNLKDAVERLDIPYPVAQDNEGATWTAYQNNY